MAKATNTKDEKDEKDDKFKEILAALEKRYGAGTIIYGKNMVQNLEVVKSGSLGLDIATGIGGIPIGKLIEIFGPESSGKSTLTLHIEGRFQGLEGEVVLIDYEHSFDKKYALNLGVDVDKLMIIQPDCMEDGYNIIETLIRSGRIRLVVIDSHTAGMPKAVIEGEVGDATIALQARFNSLGLGKIKPLLMPNRCTMIGVSQLRTAIGSYGDPDKPTGGNAWKFYSDMRMKVSKVLEKEKESNKTTVEIIKNKCARPFGKAVFAINWGEGIDRIAEVIDSCVLFKIVDMKGAYYYYNESKIGQGKEQTKQFFADNPKVAVEIETKLLAAIKDAEK